MNSNKAISLSAEYIKSSTEIEIMLKYFSILVLVI